MARFYTVQETAKILGFSTNSVYKFLDQGRLKSTRGNSRQGRFRIPHSSIEAFLDTKLSEVAVVRALTVTSHPDDNTGTPRHLISPEVTKEISLPKGETLVQPERRVVPKFPLGLAFTRLLILIVLLLTIFETITSPTITLANQVFRLLILSIVILLAYQSGGSLKDGSS